MLVHCTGAFILHWRIIALQFCAGFCHAVLCCAELLSLVTLCNSMDCSPPGSSVPGDSPSENTGWSGLHALLQGIFLTQGLNPGLPHCRWILYHLSHQSFYHVLTQISHRYTYIPSLLNLLPASHPEVSVSCHSKGST